MDFGTQFFSILCYGWAAVAIISRIAMYIMKDGWKEWEVKKAYGEKKPFWVYLVCILGLFLIGITWYIYLKNEIFLGWILSIFVTLTSVKIFVLLFKYNKFREFLKSTLNDSKKMASLNVGVLFLAVVLVGLGIFVY